MVWDACVRVVLHEAYHRGTHTACNYHELSTGIFGVVYVCVCVCTCVYGEGLFLGALVSFGLFLMIATHFLRAGL